MLGKKFLGTWVAYTVLYWTISLVSYETKVWKIYLYFPVPDGHEVSTTVQSSLSEPDGFPLQRWLSDGPNQVLHHVRAGKKQNSTF